MAESYQLLYGSATAPFLRGYTCDDPNIGELNHDVEFGFSMTNEPDGIALTKDGQYVAVIASAGTRLIVLRRVGKLWQYVTSAGALTTAAYMNVSWNDDGNFIAISRAAGTGVVYEFDGSSLTLATLPSPPSSATWCCWSGPYLYFVGTSSNSYKYAYKLEEGSFRFLGQINIPAVAGRSVFTSKDGKHVYSQAGNNLYRNLRTGDTFSPADNLINLGSAYYAGLSNSGKLLVSVSNQAPFISLYRVDLETGAVTSLPSAVDVQPSAGYNNYRKVAAFSPDDKFLFVSSTSTTDSPTTYVVDEEAGTLTKADDLKVPGGGRALTTTPLYIAGAATIYNAGVKDLLSSGVDLDNLKIMLLNDEALFNGANTTVDQVTDSGAFEVSGFGWEAGGALLEEARYEVDSSGQTSLHFKSVYRNIIGGILEPSKALIYDATSNKPFVFIDFDGKRVAETGERFGFKFDDGLILFSRR